jgi:hypothetical protein
LEDSLDKSDIKVQNQTKLSPNLNINLKPSGQAYEKGFNEGYGTNLQEIFISHWRFLFLGRWLLG